MSVPRFRIDDTVMFNASAVKGTHRLEPQESRYLVTQIMPVDMSGRYQYRLKAVGLKGQMRVAPERDLVSSAPVETSPPVQGFI